MERLLALLAVAGAALGAGIVAGDAGLSDHSAAVVTLAAFVIGTAAVMLTPGWGRSVRRSRDGAGI